MEVKVCKRHGIQSLSVQGEKLSVDKEAADHYQVFNCDETGLNFPILPDITMATSFEKTNDGRKKAKEHVYRTRYSESADSAVSSCAYS